MKTATAQSAKPVLRLLRFLQLHGPATVTGEDECLAIVAGGKRLAASATLFGECVQAGLAVSRDGVISLSPAGAERLRARLFAETNSGEGRDRPAPARTPLPAMNDSESPLARLFLRKDRNGAAWLDAEQFEAGERLRSDFERGRLQPRISANWDASVGGRGRGSGGTAELSDFALDCRRRVNAAIEALEPSLAGVALDVCCFLKGLEQVERERRWPPRSAKLMLRTALSVLARHYGLKSGRAPARIRHWGDADYRPSPHSQEGRRAPPA